MEVYIPVISVDGIGIRHEARFRGFLGQGKLALILLVCLLYAGCGGGGSGGGPKGGGGPGPGPTGPFDPSFGTAGKVTTPIGTIDDEIFSIAIQPDGKLVAGGFSTKGGQEEFALARYNTNGTPDTAFGTAHNGIVTTAIGASDDEVHAIAIQPDGKLIAAGFTGIPNPSQLSTENLFALVRYNADGTLDPSFGKNGIVTTTIGDNDDEIFALAVQSTGRVIAAGFTGSGSGGNIRKQIALVGYNADGTPDTTFGTAHTGIVTTAIQTPPGNPDDEIFSLAVQPDGQLVGAGYSFNGTSSQIALIRYSADGVLDTTFGKGGSVITPAGVGNSAGYSIAIQSDLKLVVAGFAYNSVNNATRSEFAVLRYQVDGTLDPAFGADGIVTTALGANDEALALAIQSDQKLVAAGFSNGSTSPSQFGLVRYNTDGTVDNTFWPAGNGIVTAPFGLASVAFALVNQPDGKLVAGGYSQINNNENAFGLIRYLE